MNIVFKRELADVYQYASVYIDGRHVGIIMRSGDKWSIKRGQKLSPKVRVAIRKAIKDDGGVILY